MGRTVPSFRIVIAEEKQEWKAFRNALDKSERKIFHEMWDIPRLYVSACSNSCHLVPLQPIIISILFHHYKELKECISEVEQIEEEEESEVRCERCGYEWVKRGDTVGDPEICPRCKSARWHAPRKLKGANNKK